MSDTTVFTIGYIVSTPEVCGGKPRIAGTRIRVMDVVNLHLHKDWLVERVADAFDVTPAQIHAALSYYYDHRDAIDQDLKRATESSGESLNALLRRAGYNVE